MVQKQTTVPLRCLFILFFFLNFLLCQSSYITSGKSVFHAVCNQVSISVCKMGKNCTSLINEGSVQQMSQYWCLTIKSCKTDCTKQPGILFVWTLLSHIQLAAQKLLEEIAVHDYIKKKKKISLTCNKILTDIAPLEHPTKKPTQHKTDSTKMTIKYKIK